MWNLRKKNSILYIKLNMSKVKFYRKTNKSVSEFTICEDFVR